MKLKDNKTTDTAEIPTSAQIEQFWKPIWSSSVAHNTSATWISEECKRRENINTMEDITLHELDIKQAVENTHNWKAPGPDGIHNFWLKKLTSAHALIADHFSAFLRNEAQVPTFMMKGRTHLLPKDLKNTSDPSKYRPITCLCTLYKLLTSCIATKIYEHIKHHNIVATEQKGCIKNSKGCKEQLIIDSVAMEQAFHNQRNIYTAYIDYTKAFDSIPHSWLLKALEIYKVSPNIRELLCKTMSSWEVTLNLSHKNGLIKTAPIPIKRGIFQGDALSPLWFCLALNPLSSILNETNYGFNIKGSRASQHKLSHLLYIDDIKLYASSERQLKTLLELTEDFSNDINMSFGIQKCRRLSVVSGKIVMRDFELSNNERISAMSENDTYKYLGLTQAKRMHHSEIVRVTTEEYIERVKSLLKSHLNGFNLFKAINTFAIPVLTYTFGTTKWSDTDLESVKRTTRTLLTKFGIHHPKSAVERVYLPRRQGGRGIVDITHLHRKCIHNLRLYFHEQQNQLHKVVCQSDLKYTPLNLSDTSTSDIPTDAQHFQSLLLQWKMKSIHGKYPYAIDQPEIDAKASNDWLCRPGIFSETEGFMCAIQDQVIATKNYKKYVIRAAIENDLCRRCQKQPETIHHITGACAPLAATEYLTRHNHVAKIVHQCLALRYGLITEERPYFKYTPQAVLESSLTKIYWDRSILTDHPTAHNRPDILLIEKRDKRALLIDIGVPNTHNLQECYTEKCKKYHSLAYEIKDMWRLQNVEIIPIIVSSTGVIPKTLNKSLDKLEMMEKRHAIQKAVILSTTTIVRKFLNLN
ncbi:unnamed protein product [Ceratitis capitata]|uniref:(Mediterranean fruit fly) hypothetical protein n=2 Tax=Ceratitis capitata TaxID=7213 RepID=A0A811UUJ7_CERCA|nr:unnamed protein product [Ceratitis capitata]